jgi:hypothetical protein
MHERESMIDSKTRRGSRFGTGVLFGSVALLLVATGCKTSTAVATNPQISVKESRNAAGALQGITVDGSKFASNGQVHITVALEGSGSDATPYVEADVQANASGKIHYVRSPMDCPQPADYGSGSYITVFARDTNSGISDAVNLHPGKTPDCKS